MKLRITVSAYKDDDMRTTPEGYYVMSELLLDEDSPELRLAVVDRATCMAGHIIDAVNSARRQHDSL